MLHLLPLTFDHAEPLILAEGSWCPFNSQNTVFFPEAYPLLYLPVTCSFRMTDIWRSFVAQWILWGCGAAVSFHSASVTQERNPHDLLRDFEEEIPGLLGNKRLVKALEGAALHGGWANMEQDLRVCYQALIREGFLGDSEERLLDAWLLDLAPIW
jgi:hypothetical protein